MELLLRLIKSLIFVCLAGMVLIVAACSDRTVKIQKNENNSRLAGTWLLKARVTDAGETPATDRQMRLFFKDDQTFRAEYRGDETQKWISAGKGAFSYDLPILKLYWDSGQALILLVEEKDRESIVVHHSRNLVPLKDQEPTEIFLRQKTPAGGPTKQAS